MPRRLWIGTSNGYSALWISLGLQTTNGRLITHEIRPDRAATARSNFKRAGVEDVITVVVGDAHQTIATIEGPVDILFIDAEKPGYADYLHNLPPNIRPGGLILADNANKPSHFPISSKQSQPTQTWRRSAWKCSLSGSV